MAKTVLPAAVLVVTLAAMLALAAPAYPQEEVVVSSEDLAADQDGNLVGPRPPEYQVTEDGTLIIDGDVLIDCSAIGLEGGSARACESAGFPTAVDDPSGTLPETGGGPPLLPIGLLLLTCGGLVALRGTGSGRGDSVRCSLLGRR